MTEPLADPPFLATLLHASRYGRRRDVGRLLHGVNLPCDAGGIDYALHVLHEHPLIAGISESADKIEQDRIAAQAAEDRGKPQNVPPWLIAESTDALREFIIHTRFPRFIAEVVLLEPGEEPPGLVAYDDQATDQAMLHPIWQDDVSQLTPEHLQGLFIAAMRELELYGQASEALTEQMMEEDDDEAL